jgi:hypothetical protein
MMQWNGYPLCNWETGIYMQSIVMIQQTSHYSNQSVLKITSQAIYTPPEPSWSQYFGSVGHDRNSSHYGSTTACSEPEEEKHQ